MRGRGKMMTNDETTIATVAAILHGSSWLTKEYTGSEPGEIRNDYWIKNRAEGAVERAVEIINAVKRVQCPE